MKHIKGKMLVLMGFLLVNIVTQGMEKPRSGSHSGAQSGSRPSRSSRSGSRSGSRHSFGTVMSAESPEAQFWIALQLDPISYDLLDAYFKKYDANYLLNMPFQFAFNEYANYFENSQGLLPLELAVDTNNAELASFLISRGANVNNLDIEDRAIALQLQRIYDIISDNAVSLNNKRDAIVNVIVNTALLKEDKLNLLEGFLRDYSSLLGSEYIVILESLKTILNDNSYGDIDNINSKIAMFIDGSVLSVAILNGFIELASYLVLHGANINDPGVHRLPIVSLIVDMLREETLTDIQFTQRIRLVQLLMQRGANINAYGTDLLTVVKALTIAQSSYLPGTQMGNRVQRVINAINNPTDPKV